MEEGTQTQEAPPQEQTPPQDAPRTFTQEEVNKIVSERVNAWNSFGNPDELKSKMERLEQLERFNEEFSAKLNGKQVAPQGQTLTDEDKKVLDYLNRISPGFTDYQSEREQFKQAINGLYQQRWTEINDRNTEYLAQKAREAGYPEEAIQDFTQRVADSIRGNPEDHKAYLQTAGKPILDKHFASIDGWIKKFNGTGFAQPGKSAPGATYAKAKAATQKLPPTPKSGGVSLPQPPNPKEMSGKDFVNAAYASLIGK